MSGPRSLGCFLSEGQMGGDFNIYFLTILCFHRFFLGTDHHSFWDNLSLPFPVNWRKKSLEQFSDASLETSTGFWGGPEFPNVLNFSKRRHPYSVVLFDEMEKAHPQVGPRHGHL